MADTEAVESLTSRRWVPETEGEGLVVGFENLVEEGLDVLLVFFDELFLAST